MLFEQDFVSSQVGISEMNVIDFVLVDVVCKTWSVGFNCFHDNTVDVQHVFHHLDKDN